MRSITTPRLLIFGCATLSALLLGMATASAETSLEKIKRTGVMTSANTFSYPPFGFIEDGKQVGFDVDLGNEIARRMGVKLTFEAIDFRNHCRSHLRPGGSAHHRNGLHAGPRATDRFLGAVF
jgi:ABC-type amino acid transport substrate-binding protein